MDTQPVQQNTGLDPTIVALTKSIGMAESGGKYDAGDNTGDNAGSQGAYQMTPGFLQKWAPKAGIQYQPGMQLQPSQQDQIAYNAVKTMGTEGDPSYSHLGKLTPAQIASVWNTGDPNAYLDPEYGKNNTYGSTENYVNEVGKNYNKLMGVSNNQTSQSTPELSNNSNNQGPDWGSIAGMVGGGLALALPWLLGPEVGAPADAAALTYIPEAGATAADIASMVGEGLNVGKGATAAAGTIAKNPGIISRLLKLGGTALGITGAEDIGGKVLNSVIGGGNDQNPPTGTSNNGGTSESNNQENFSPENQQSAMATTAVQKAITQALQGTQSNRVFSESQPGKDIINTAAMFGLIKPDEQGNMYFDEEKRQQAMNEVANLDDKIVAANGGTNTNSQVMNYMGQEVDKDKFSTPLDRQKAKDVSKQEMIARGATMDKNGNIGGEMSLSDMRKAQKEHYAASQGGWKSGKTSHEIMAHKALGKAYGLAIREKLQNPELHDRVMKMEQNLINVKALNKRLSGKKAPQNKGIWESMLRQGARAAEIYIGDKLGGPVGAIIGGLVGEQFNKKIEKKFGRNIFETKEMRAALDILHDTKPREYLKLVSALKKHGVDLKNEEINAREGMTAEEALKNEQKNPSIEHMDELVNEIKQEKIRKNGLVNRKPTKKKGLIKRKT